MGMSVYDRFLVGYCILSGGFLIGPLGRVGDVLLIFLRCQNYSPLSGTSDQSYRLLHILISPKFHPKKKK